MILRTKIKNNEKKIHIKKYLTDKNLRIFITTFFIISIIIGIFFYFFLNNANKDYLKNNLKDFFIIDNKYDYLSIFKNTVINNLINILFIWIFGISIIGIIVILITCFVELFGFGLSITSFFSTFGIKGIVGLIFYIFPSKLLYLLTLLFVSYKAIKLSIALIKNFFLKKEMKLENYIKNYLRILLILIITSIIYSILEVFISPLMIKAFTFFIK